MVFWPLLKPGPHAGGGGEGAYGATSRGVLGTRRYHADPGLPKVRNYGVFLKS